MSKVEHSIVKQGESEYILRIFRGVINTEDIMDSFVYILNNNMISNECKGIVTDLRDSELLFSMDNFKSLLIYIKSNIRLMNLKIAVVVDTSDKIVFPMMASSEPDMLVQPFSTNKAAISWVLQ